MVLFSSSACGLQFSDAGSDEAKLGKEEGKCKWNFRGLE